MAFKPKIVEKNNCPNPFPAILRRNQKQNFETRILVLQGNQLKYQKNTAMFS